MKVKPKKLLGQHFLINKPTLDKIIEAAEIKDGDLVLEVGPGTGNLTEKLLERGARVIAVEKDPAMIEALSARPLPRRENLAIIEGDILYEMSNVKAQMSKPQLKTQNYKVVANIPYYLTSRLIRKYMSENELPSLIVLTVQKEVAERIVAKAPKMSLLGLSVQLYGKPKIIAKVPREYFWPKPKVDSAIIKISDIASPKIDENFFFKLARAGFSQKRKYLISNLSKKLGLSKEKMLEAFSFRNLSPTARAQELSLGDWSCLCAKLNPDLKKS